MIGELDRLCASVKFGQDLQTKFKPELKSNYFAAAGEYIMQVCLQNAEGSRYAYAKATFPVHASRVSGAGS